MTAFISQPSVIAFGDITAMLYSTRYKYTVPAWLKIFRHSTVHASTYLASYVINSDYSNTTSYCVQVLQVRNNESTHKKTLRTTTNIWMMDDNDNTNHINESTQLSQTRLSPRHPPQDHTELTVQCCLLQVDHTDLTVQSDFKSQSIPRLWLPADPTAAE